MDSIDVPNNTSPDLQVFKPKPEKKNVALLSELRRIIERIEESSEPEVLSKLPDMPIAEVALLIQRYYPICSRSHEIEPSELPLLLQTISCEFQTERSKAESSRSTSNDLTMDKGVLTEFTLFPKLPAELRRKVWIYSIPGPRIIEIYGNKNESTVPSLDSFSNLNISKASQKFLGSLLAVNIESREVVASRYSMIRSRKLGILSMSKHSLFLFDAKKDLIYFNHIASPSFIPFMFGAKDTGSSNIRSIALPLGYFIDCVFIENEKEAKCLGQLLLRLENLVELILVDGHNSSLHNGWPLKLFGLRTKTMAELVVERDTNLTIGSCLTQICVQNAWDPFIAQHPVMKPLEKVALVFLQAERIDPPKLLSDKVMEMWKIEKNEQATPETKIEESTSLK